MVTVDLFHLINADHHIGHVRILRDDAQYLAIASFPHDLSSHDAKAESGFDSYRLQASSRKAAIEAVLTWAKHRFDGRCSLQTIQSISPAGNDNSSYA